MANNKVLQVPEDYTKHGALKDYAMGVEMKALKVRLPVIAAAGILVIGLLGLAIRRRRQERKHT